MEGISSIKGIRKMDNHTQQYDTEHPITHWISRVNGNNKRCLDSRQYQGEKKSRENIISDPNL